jgi:tetratricopeptide (TPR) repeat protein
MSVRTQRPRIQRPAVNGRADGSPAAVDTSRQMSQGWMWAAGFGVALLAALIAYWPALHGEFVFDDAHMQFTTVHPEQLPFRAWVIGARPLVSLSYWINYQLEGTDPFGYHLVNIFFHALASVMVFLITRKILELAAAQFSWIGEKRRTLVAGFCAALFLLHPVQTEAVAYVAQRSENMSVALAFAAWACFLYRPSNDIRFPSVAAVLLLFGASVAAKEHVAVLPLVILLTDYYWNPGFSWEGVRRNWRLYGIFLVGCLAVGAFLYSYLANEPTVGFNMQVPWYQYLFTQCRVLFLYLRLFLAPVGLNADYAVELSRTPLEHGAIFGMLALATASVAAMVWRKRYPIASYGFFVALVFFLPTSSIMPIKDLAAERRMYLPMIGLLLMTAEVLVRVRWNERRLATVLATILLVFGVLTWNRSTVWSSSLALWSDTVEKSPEKARAHFGLATASYSAQRYADAIRQYELTTDGPDFKRDGMFYSDWALALDGAGRLNEAIQMGGKAMEMSPGAATYAHQAMYLAKDGDFQPALDLLEKAEKADSSYEPLYIERGDILMQVGMARRLPDASWKPQACAAFQKAWSLSPKDPSSVKGLGVLGCAQPR